MHLIVCPLLLIMHIDHVIFLLLVMIDNVLSLITGHYDQAFDYPSFPVFVDVTPR